MPTVNKPSGEAYRPDYSQYVISAQQSGSRPTATTARPTRLYSLDVKLHTSERDSRKDIPQTRGSAASRPDREQSTTKPRPTNLLAISLQQSESESRSTTVITTARPTRLYSLDVKLPTSERDSKKDSPQTKGSAASRLDKEQSTTRPRPTNLLAISVQQSESRSSTVITTAFPTRLYSLDVKLHTSERDSRKEPPQARGSTALSSTRRPQNTQATLLGPDYRSKNEQATPQLPGLMSFIPKGGPSPPKDKYQLLKEEYYRNRDELKQARAIIENNDRELKKTEGELLKAKYHLRHESQRSKDSINSLQNELIDVHQKLEDAKKNSEVRRKKLFGAQVDTLSILEVREKVTALNEEIFQAAAALGEGLVYKRHEVSQANLDAATAVSQEMVGEKMTNILISRSQKQNPEISPLLVQVVLQIFMVKFCVSKIQSWYPGDSALGEFLSAIYSENRSTGATGSVIGLEKQAASARLRDLTPANSTRTSTETWNKELHKYYKKLQSVLVTASWAARSPEDENSYGHRLPPILKAIYELRMAIGEKSTSPDLDIIAFECDKIYDPATMEDAHADGRQSTGKRAHEAIVGTTGIGLGKVIDAFQFRTLIPAKIVLTSTMKEALKSIQTSRLKKKKPAANTDAANRDGRD